MSPHSSRTGRLRHTGWFYVLHLLFRNDRIGFQQCLGEYLKEQQVISRISFSSSIAFTSGANLPLPQNNAKAIPVVFCQVTDNAETM